MEPVVEPRAEIGVARSLNRDPAADVLDGGGETWAGRRDHQAGVEKLLPRCYHSPPNQDEPA